MWRQNALSNLKFLIWCLAIQRSPPRACVRPFYDIPFTRASLPHCIATLELMDQWYFFLFTIRGIPIRAHMLLPVLWVFTALRLFDLGVWSKGRVVTMLYNGILYGPVLWSTVLVHELGHAFVALWLGFDVTQILLWPLGGISCALCMPLAYVCPLCALSLHYVASCAVPHVRALRMPLVERSLMPQQPGAFPWNKASPALVHNQLKLEDPRSSFGEPYCREENSRRTPPDWCVFGARSFRLAMKRARGNRRLAGEATDLSP